MLRWELPPPQPFALPAIGSSHFYPAATAVGYESNSTPRNTHLCQTFLGPLTHYSKPLVYVLHFFLRVIQNNRDSEKRSVKFLHKRSNGRKSSQID